jgi:flagellar hook-basal body complex protein FliE
MSDANMNIIVNDEGDDENNKVGDILKDAIDEVQRVIEQNDKDSERIAKEREAELESQMAEVKAIEAQVDKKLQDVLLSVDQTEDVIQAIDPANIELDPETVKKLKTGKMNFLNPENWKFSGFQIPEGDLKWL